MLIVFVILVCAGIGLLFVIKANLCPGCHHINSGRVVQVRGCDSLMRTTSYECEDCGHQWRESRSNSIW